MQILITRYATQIAKTGKAWAFLSTVEVKSGQTKEHIFNPENLNKAGFNPNMVSDLQNEDIVLVEGQYDSKGNLVEFKPITAKK